MEIGPAGEALVRVAVVHTDVVTRLGLRTALEGRPCALVVHEASTVSAIVHELTDVVQVVLYQLTAPWDKAIADLGRLRNLPGKPKVIVMGAVTDRLAQESLQAGALGVLTTCVLLEELCQAVCSVGKGALHTNAWMLAHVGKMGQRSIHASDPKTVVLTLAEAKVLYWLVKHPGLTYAAIGLLYGKSGLTIATHKRNLLLKFGLPSRNALTQLAMAHHLC